MLPKKLHESWFTVHLGERVIGADWIFLEPHKDRTVWFERRVRFGAEAVALDNHERARFSLHRPARRGRGARAPAGRDKEREGWPELRWCAFREGEKKHEIVGAGTGEVAQPGATLLALPDDALPSYLLPLVAAGASREPGQALRFSVLWEWERRVEPGHELVCRGPESLEAGGERFDVTQYTVEREGRAWRTYWIDVHRRIRKIDYGGPYAILSTRADAAPALGLEA